MSSDTNSPFEELRTIEPAVMTDSTAFELIVRRLAEIEDELSSLGAEKLNKEKNDLRSSLKDFMAKNEVDSVYDETSNFEAVMTPRSHDVWNMNAFSSLLSPTQKKRYIRRMIDEAAAKEGIANGDLSRAQLEAKGAVRKEAGQKALYVRERKGGTKR